MKIYFDVDETVLTKPEDKTYDFSVPMEGKVKEVNDLYHKGHTIVFFTARGMGQFDGDETLAKSKFYDFTYAQLTDFGFKFHKLILGKPHYDVLVCDKTINPYCGECVQRFKNMIKVK